MAPCVQHSTEQACACSLTLHTQCSASWDQEMLGVIMIPKFGYFSYSVNCYTSIVHYLLNILEKILLNRRTIDHLLCCLTFLEGKTDWVGLTEEKLLTS